MKMFRSSFLLALLFSLLFVHTAQAQDQNLVISLRRDFGYSSGGIDIQGLFSITANYPGSLASVSFYVDQTLIGKVSQTPFKLQFSTDNYPLGIHKIHAVGTTQDGASLKSQVVTAKFVSAGEGWQTAMKIVIPILGIALLAVLFTTVFPLLTGSRTRPFPVGVPLSYPLGGAICPKCQRPFAIHLFSLNMLTHKYDRCPYCGKSSMVKFAPLGQLRSAELLQVERANEKAQIPGMSVEEQFKKELDDSKFNDA